MKDDPLDNDSVIDISPRRRRRIWVYVVLLVAALLFLTGSQIVNIYVDSLWFSSLGYSSVYWYKFRLGGLLFLVFFVVTFLIIRLPFVWVSRALPEVTERPRLKVTTVEEMREINFLPFIYRPGVWVLSAGVALISAISMSGSWSDFALYLNGQQSGTVDPVFGRDIGFYLFKLPVLELLSGWLTTVAIVLGLAIAGSAIYVLYLERLRGASTAETRRRVVRLVSFAIAPFAVALAISTYLGRFDLLNEKHDLFTGVSYTDANVSLTAMNVLAILLVLSAVALVVNGVSMRRPRIIFMLAALVAVVWLLGLNIIPGSVHSFSVKPNELAKESPYIAHNIEMTRRAFAIEGFEERPYQPSPTLTSQDLQANRETLDNIRLWDRRALQATLAQIQEIRTYYDFNTPDVDRYVLSGRLRQVFLAAREINADQLPEKNWINQHLVYTHGYGVTMSTVNEFTPEGQPNLILKNMPVESSAPEIKVERPEIYFGERANTHVYVRTKPQHGAQPEFNFPAPTGEAYTTYEGGAGIEVGGMIRQLALSLYLGDGSNLLFSDYITSDSRVLIHRNVRERVQRIAPFLMFEDDPYVVINREGRLFWIIDGFTYSEAYPYSTSYQAQGRNVNYLRNSVKAVVDAYEGSVTLYVFDNVPDPIIATYQSIFPSLFRPRSEMPEDLLAHVRYPSLLVETQARVYTLYHMQNTQTFYNHEDVWAIPSSETPAQQGQEPELMQPYHVLMDLPAEQQHLEFLNILPFTPAGQGRNNMIGWMAARSDGESYGQTIVYTFPKNVTINGPAQIRARVNQDAKLSQLMSLWNQKGSELLRGNLLVIPVANSLLYVEAFFLQSQGTESKLPELRQVAVATQDRLASGANFDEALRLLFPDVTPQQAAPPSQQVAAQQPRQQTQQQGQAQAPPPATGDLDRLYRQAEQQFADYKRLNSEGKFREAGEKLDQLNQTFEEIRRRRGQ